MRLLALAASAFIAASTVAWIRFRHQHIWQSAEDVYDECVICGTHHPWAVVPEDEDGLTPPIFI